MSYAEDADRLQGNTVKLYYFAEKDRLGWFMCFVGSWGLLFGVCLRKSARSAGDIGGSFVRIDWVRLRVILSQRTQRAQTNTARLYYFAEKDRLVWFMCVWGLGFCLRRSARSAGDIGGSFVRIDWVRLHVILSQRTQRAQTNTARLYYFAEKDRLGWLMCFVVWGVVILGGVSA